MSEKFLLVKGYYDSGLWTITRVQYAVYMGWITEAEFVTITGEPYTPPPAPPSPTPVVAEENDVMFIDYDGTIVYSYTAQEFLALTEMPANPTHEGLTSQGWNWSLTDAQDYVEDYGKLVIGQMYITDDGKTRIHIKLEEGRLSPRLCLYINGTVDVDWGDETEHTTMTGSSLNTLQATIHEYAAPGNYVIALSVTTGTFTFKNAESNGTGIISKYTTQSGAEYRRGYTNTIQSINIGSGITSISAYAFAYQFSLSSVTIPNSITSMGNNVFSLCYSLSSVTIPNSITSIGDSVFYSCYSLSSVSISREVTSIGSGAFYYCYSLSLVTIPNQVTSITSQMCYYAMKLLYLIIPNSITTLSSCFYNNSCLVSITFPESITSIPTLFLNSACQGLSSVKFKSTTPPILAASSSLGTLPTDCIIYVPQGSLSDYTSATNYPSSSTYTYVEY